MTKYEWKDRYIDVNGNIINSSSIVNYCSINGIFNGNGTRNNPFGASQTMELAYNSRVILSNGYLSLKFNIAEGSPTLIGQNKCNTKIYPSVTYGRNAGDLFIKDISFMGGIMPNTALRLYNSILDLSDSLPDTPYTFNLINSSIIKSLANCTANNIQNSFYNSIDLSDTTKGTAAYRNLNIIKNCDVAIIQSHLTANSDQRVAFDGCKFKIGTETEFVALTGTTEDELRTNFKSRCEAAGLTVPNVADTDGTAPMGRWVFANDISTTEGYVIKDSIVDMHQTRKFVYFGINKTGTVAPMPVTLNAATPNSFTPNTEESGLVVTGENAITMYDDDFTQAQINYIDSKPMMLGPGLSKLTLLDIINNFPIEQGVMVNYPQAYESVLIGNTINANTNYLVRSGDENEATVTYNGVVYSSNLTTRKNIFRGIAAKPAYDSKTDNAVIYPIIDLANHQKVQIRIVREIPSDIITTQQLEHEYWYMVAPNDVNDTNGYITYEGVDYPCYSSFLVRGSYTNVTAINGNLHLRPMWWLDYGYTSSGDKYGDFWKDKQEPVWCDVVLDDLRCLMQADKAYSEEMKETDGKYVTSGHPSFYKAIEGVNGIPVPAYDIVGKYFQLRIPLTTLNPM